MNSQRAFSGALLLKALRLLLGDEPWQAQEIVSGAAEDEDAVHFVQSPAALPGEWAGLFQPSEAVLDQPSPAQANRIAGMGIVNLTGVRS